MGSLSFFSENCEYMNSEIKGRHCYHRYRTKRNGDTGSCNFTTAAVGHLEKFGVLMSF